MRLQPVFSNADFDFDRDVERDGGLHFFFDNGADFFFLGLEKVEDEFVVNLQQHSRFQISRCKFAMDVDHGEFDHVGSGALNGSVDGVTFGPRADRVV